VAAVVIIPLLLICGAETALRVAGYGYRTTFFRPLRIGGEEYLVENDKFGWRFFPPEISRSPSPVRMLAHKPAGTFRIFLFGESAALGDPEPAYGVGRYLQTLLQERYPRLRFEVVCVAMTAINSHAVLPLARECAALQADLWIIYMGNNEMIGPFGAVTVFGRQSPPLWYVRLNLAIQKTRLGQLLASGGRRLSGVAGAHGPSWGGMQMFLKNRIAPEDQRKEKVYYCFKRNLEDILRVGRAAHVPMILSTVAVNLKDCAPFGSLTNTIAGASGPQFEQLYAEAVEEQGRGDFAVAARGFENAAALEPHHAELHFHWGQCLLELTNAAAAKAHFTRARDDDALPFRADSRINATMSETAARLAGRDLTLCDAVSSLAEHSPVGIPGDEAFYEHVHLNFAGNYRLALALADDVVPSLPAAITQTVGERWASQETCEKELGLTDWNRRDVYENVRRRLLQPPFTGQSANAQKARTYGQRLEELHRLLNATNVEPARKIYLEAIRRAPEDFRLHVNYAAFLEAIQDMAGAEAEWKEVQGLVPHHYLAYFQIGRLLAEQGQAEQARHWLLRALEMRPDLSEGWYELGRLEGASGQYEAALVSFQRARQLVPGEPRYHSEMAKALIKLNRGPEAIAQLEEALRIGSVTWEAHYLLGEQLAFAGRIPEARREFEQTLRLKPGYAMAHLNLGVALVKEGQLEDARREFEEVLRLEPENKAAKNALSQLSGRPR
jgi:tetratricopeptide (TPR) repeat protein